MTLQSELARKLHRDCTEWMQMRNCLRQKKLLEVRLPEAIHQKREADTALAEYEFGGFGVWLDKVTGKWEDKRENLRRAASAAGAQLESLRQELARLEAALGALSPREFEKIREEIMELPEPEREILMGFLGRISAGELKEQLAAAKSALLEAQKWARPDIRLEAIPGYTKAQLLTEAENCARECVPLLQEIGDCGIRLEIHAYFQNPSGYIHAVASPYGELDRINSALGVIGRTEKQVEELLLQLTGEGI